MSVRSIVVSRALYINFEEGGCLTYIGREGFVGRVKPDNASARMKCKIDTEQGRYQYGRRLGTVEPVFANICSAHRLRRFSLRSKKKVNAQWLLYCMVHNIGKLQRFGEAKTQ
jgi:Transposase DDE domain